MGAIKSSPILVTGSHRSGTSWVGRIIAESSLIGFIPEPFNIGHRPGICRAHFDNWFTYICDENAYTYHNDLSLSLSFKYQLFSELKVVRNPKDVARLLRDFIRFTIYGLLNKRPLMKDPIAVFSAEWLATNFNMDVIVLIRHPAAFAGSVKKANWSFPFNHFLRQPLLMQNHLYEFKTEIEEFANAKKDIVAQAILLWKIIYYMILKYKKKHPNWIFVRHEDLSADPIFGFSEIFHRLELLYSRSVKKNIINLSSSSNPTEQRSLFDLKRDSKSNINNWKNRLTEIEIRRIRAGTNDICSQFYDESDWI